MDGYRKWNSICLLLSYERFPYRSFIISLFRMFGKDNMMINKIFSFIPFSFSCLLPHTFPRLCLRQSTAVPKKKSHIAKQYHNLINEVHKNRLKWQWRGKRNKGGVVELFKVKLCERKMTSECTFHERVT